MTKYNQQKAEEIADLIANGATLKEIEDKTSVSRVTIFTWMWKHPEFYQMWDKAKEFGTHAMNEIDAEMIKTCPNDANSIAKLRLYLEHRRWQIGKYNQRKYGDKITAEVNVTNNLASALDQAIAARAASKTIDHVPSNPVPPLVIDVDPANESS